MVNVTEKDFNIRSIKGCANRIERLYQLGAPLSIIEWEMSLLRERLDSLDALLKTSE
jgi:hypothetical protein